MMKFLPPPRLLFAGRWARFAGMPHAEPMPCRRSRAGPLQIRAKLSPFYDVIFQFCPDQNTCRPAPPLIHSNLAPGTPASFASCGAVSSGLPVQSVCAWSAHQTSPSFPPHIRAAKGACAGCCLNERNENVGLYQHVEYPPVEGRRVSASNTAVHSSAYTGRRGTTDRADARAGSHSRRAFSPPHLLRDGLRPNSSAQRPGGSRRKRAKLGYRVRKMTISPLRDISCGLAWQQKRHCAADRLRHFCRSFIG